MAWGKTPNGASMVAVSYYEETAGIDKTLTIGEGLSSSGTDELELALRMVVVNWTTTGTSGNRETCFEIRDDDGRVITIIDSIDSNMVVGPSKTDEALVYLPKIGDQLPYGNNFIAITGITGTRIYSHLPWDYLILWKGCTLRTFEEGTIDVLDTMKVQFFFEKVSGEGSDVGQRAGRPR